jgi:hypothetical protein
MSTTTASEAPSLTQDELADIVVVGAGIAGYRQPTNCRTPATRSLSSIAAGVV